jgi:hypothetical protein
LSAEAKAGDFQPRIKNLKPKIVFIPEGLSMVKRTRTASAAGDGPQLEIVASVRTDKGCVREINEDSGRFVRPSDPALLARKGSLLVVADGMGGHSAGEVASQMAVELVSSLYYEAAGDDAPAALVAMTDGSPGGVTLIAPGPAGDPTAAPAPPPG